MTDKTETWIKLKETKPKKEGVWGENKQTWERYIFPNNTEKPNIQEEKKKFEEIKTKLKRVQAAKGWDDAHNIEKDKAKKSLEASMKGFDLWATTKDLEKNSKEEKENFVESREMKDKKIVLDKAQSEYQDTIKKIYEMEKSEIMANKWDNKKQNNLLDRLNQKYLNEYVKDFEIDSDKKQIDEKQIYGLSKTLPDAYRDLLLGKKLDSKTPLWSLQKTILQRVADGAASIDKDDFKNDKGYDTKAYQEALKKNFEDITGIKLDETKRKEILSSLPKNKKNSNTPLIQALASIDWDSSWPNQYGGGYTENNNNPLSWLESGKFWEMIKQYLTKGGGPEREDVVRKYHAAAWLNAGLGTPWCMSFVQFILRNHYGYNGPKTASARDGLQIWTAAEKPKIWDLVLMPRNGGSGFHIAFVSNINAQWDQISYIGGNQSHRVCEKQTSIKPWMKFRSITKK